jgi:hypothetical protein
LPQSIEEDGINGLVDGWIAEMSRESAMCCRRLADRSIFLVSREVREGNEGKARSWALEGIQTHTLAKVFEWYVTETGKIESTKGTNFAKGALHQALSSWFVSSRICLKVIISPREGSKGTPLRVSGDFFVLVDDAVKPRRAKSEMV